MIILGVVLLVLGLIFGIYILWIVGIVLACVGAALWIAGQATHRPIGGRRYWY